MNALRQYQQVKTDTSTEDANPHRLVQMLYEGALERIAAAKGHIQRGEMARKGEMIGKAITIIGGLRGGLKVEAYPEMIANLDALYDYMTRRLLQANLASDPEILDEVTVLLRELKEAWDAIAPGK